MLLHKIRTFWKLSFRRKYLFGLTFLMSVYTYFLFKYFRKIASFGDLNANVNEEIQDIQLIDDIRFAIHITAKKTPWENVCRHQAYQAKLLCMMFKIPYKIFIGFKINETTNEIEGHAWTEVNHQMITGFCNANEYTIQHIYSNF